MLELIPDVVLISGMFCLTILSVTFLIVLWKSLSCSKAYVSAKSYLWVPITVGIIGLCFEYSRKLTEMIFVALLLLIGIYYYSETIEFLRTYCRRNELGNVDKKERAKKKEHFQ